MVLIREFGLLMDDNARLSQQQYTDNSVISVFE